jgi:alpha-ribazole phosphatase
MNVYVIRHTHVNIASGVCYGQTDVPVADTFLSECTHIQQKLPPNTAWTVYSSPLRRCRQLAEHLCPNALHTDPRLMELNFGAWEGKRWDEIDEMQLNAWSANWVHRRCPNGESFYDLSQRVAVFWQDVCQQPRPNVLIITHGGVIRALLSDVLKFPLEHAMRLTIDFGSVTKLRVLDYGVMVDGINC